MAVDDILQLEEHFTHQGNPNQFTWAWKVVATDTVDTDPQTLLQEWAVTEHDLLRAIFNDDTLFDCTVVRKIHPTIQLPAEELTNDVGTRPVVDADLPGQCCMVIQMNDDTGEPTPRRRGRDFVTGRDGIDHADGVWNQAAADLVLGFYSTALGTTIDSGNGGSYQFGIWSVRQLTENENPIFVSNGGATPDPPTFGNDPFTAITVFRARSVVRTQRRRQPERPCGVFLTETPP